MQDPQRHPYAVATGGSLVLSLPWPPTVNLYYRSVTIAGHQRVLISKRGRAYREAVMCRLKGNRTHFAERVAVAITAHPPDKRKRDLDNMLKPTLDAIQHAGVLADDSLIDELSILRAAPDKPGHMTVEVWPL